MYLKKLCTFFFVLLFLVAGFSVCLGQSCLPEGILFELQEEIDAFNDLHPDCIHIEGDLIIEGLIHSTITNLNGLSQIESVGGDLIIEENSLLKSLAGLSSIKSIGGNLKIKDNGSLINLNGLNALTQVDNDVTISYNYDLDNLEGLEALKTINGSFIIASNSNLTTLTSLTIKKIQTDFDISNNHMLKDLQGLETLEFVGGNLRINANRDLYSLFGLSLDFRGTESLIISYNHNLISLESIENFYLRNLNNVNIFFNKSLSDCAVKSICEYLIDGELILENNTESCNDTSTLQGECHNDSDVNFNCWQKPSPNPVNNYLRLNYICQSPDIVSISIYDCIGQLLFSQKLDINNFNTPIDVSSLSRDLYFLKVEDSNETNTIFSFLKN